MAGTKAVTSDEFLPPTPPRLVHKTFGKFLETKLKMVQAGKGGQGGEGGTEHSHYFGVEKWLQETPNSSHGDHPQAMLGLWGQLATKQMLLTLHGWLANKAADSRRISRGTWVRAHKDGASKRSPKSRPDHISATINNVCSKVGGTERGPYWRRPTCTSNVKEKLVCMLHKGDTVRKCFAHIHNRGCLWLLRKSLIVGDSKINFFLYLFIYV